jgi:hypothetical protein
MADVESLNGRPAPRALVWSLVIDVERVKLAGRKPDAQRLSGSQEEERRLD